MREQVRFPGARFGQLVLVEKIKHFDKGKHIYIWRCQCDCGNEKFVVETNLRKEGGTRSCGCANLNKNYEIQNGDQFGYFTVIELSPEKAERKGKFYSQYLCKCICGKELLVERTTLLRRNKKSCGCVARLGRPPKKTKKTKAKIKGTIEDFMFLSEAAEQYGVTFNAVNERIKHAKKTNKIAEWEERGLIKQYTPAGASKGHWLIARQLLDMWFE